MNPWREVKMPKDAVEPQRTNHYTLEEAEDLISALVNPLRLHDIRVHSIYEADIATISRSLRNVTRIASFLSAIRKP
jgi:hypothetical protein